MNRVPSYGILFADFMKYGLLIIVVLVLIAGGFWAGTKTEKNKDEETVSPSASPVAIATTPMISVTATPTVRPMPSRTLPPLSPTTTVNVGNTPGSKAPDFRLHDVNGQSVSLRDFIGKSEVTIEFTNADQLMLQGRLLLDPEHIVHRLYGVSSLPYTVRIDINGIIK